MKKATLHKIKLRAKYPLQSHTKNTRSGNEIRMNFGKFQSNMDFDEKPKEKENPSGFDNSFDEKEFFVLTMQQFLKF